MIRYRRMILCLTVICIATLPSRPYLANPSPCDSKILTKAIPDDTGYKRRSPSMCEGVYTSLTSGEPILEMVSLTIGSLAYDLKTDRRLYVDIPGKEEFRGAPIRLQSVGREEGVHYRMDAYLPPKETFVWPLNTVLAKEDIEDFKLGVYGWVESEGQRIFLPVAVMTKNQGPKAPASIRLIVRTPLRVDWMAWRFAPEKASWGKFKEIKRSDLDEGGWIVLKIPPGEKGILKVEVQGKKHNPERKGSIWLPKILVFRPGS